MLAGSDSCSIGGGLSGSSRRFAALSLMLLLVASLLSLAHAGCGTLPSTSYCSNIFKAGYNASAVEPSTGDPDTIACPNDVEDDAAVARIPLVVGLMRNATVRLELARFLCGKYFPPCSDHTLQPCLSQCTYIAAHVSSAGGTPDPETDLGKDALLIQQSGYWTGIMSSGSCADYAAQTSCNGDDNLAYAVSASNPGAAAPVASCEAYAGTACKGIVSQVYVPAGKTQADLEAPLKTARSLGPLVPVQLPQCPTHLAKFACAQAFWPCFVKNHTLFGAERTFLLPQPAELGVCNNYTTGCAPFVSSVIERMPSLNASLAPDCNTITGQVGRRARCDSSVVNGSLLFPSTDAVFAGGVTVPPHDYTAATVQRLPR